MTDKEIIRLTREFKKGLMGKRNTKSMCFVVTFPLQGYLSFCGLKTKLVEGEIKTNEGIWNHYWLKLPDGRILDPTADQFNNNLSEIYLGNKSNYYRIIK